MMLSRLARTSAAPAGPPPLGDRFRLVQRLGAGAVGEVYLVENLAQGRLEALKVLTGVQHLHAAQIAEGRGRREVRLAHPNIVQTHESGRLPNGQLYVTMEYVAGPSLAQVLDARGPLPLVVVLGILEQVAETIHFAQARGVIHRDLKPHNLILADDTYGKIIKVLDVGMAKILDDKVREGAVLSADIAAFGTPQYMSPEQCMGKPPDPRTDLYALGCVAFELVTGETPFHGALAQMFVAHVKKAPPVPSQRADDEVPPELDALILRCLAKAPEQRFQTGAELAAAVRQVPGYRPLRRLPADAMAEKLGANKPQI